MADSTSNPSPSTAVVPTRPISEALLNDKWDRCLSSLVVKSSLGLSFGVVFSFLVFKRRSWPVWAGIGFGAGRAWEECDSAFRRPPQLRDGMRVFNN